MLPGQIIAGSGEHLRGAVALEAVLDKAVLKMVALPRSARKAIVAAFDGITCIFAVWMAYWLRMGEWQLASRPVCIFGAIAILSWFTVAFSSKTYRSLVRFSGRRTVLGLLRSCALMSAILAAILFNVRIENVPRTLSVIHPLVFFLGLAAQRLIFADLITAALGGTRRSRTCTRVLIYGAGRPGQQLAISVRDEVSLKLVGFVDEESNLKGRLMEGTKIWHTSELEPVLLNHNVDEVFLAIPSCKRSVRRAVVERICKVNGTVRVRVLPTLSQLASGRVTVSDLREIQIEELLGRDEVPPHPHLMSKNIDGRRVLVTGAGGSIGSELCRQIIRQRPVKLILAEQSEHALYCIDSELRDLQRREGLEIELQPELINVAADNECRRLFARSSPDTVFHAAAYKHVPLIEANPIAGIRNNVLGTLNVSLAAEEAGTRNVILVSTDKAVRPTNLMGASKRVCELIVQARAAEQSGTRYTSVRFGNVLGSSGSVIPRFRQQIAAGGPVTITHREATRYFMTIPEAAQLVIQSGALAEDGEILLLDMGKPVRILDLARAMIELSGLNVADDDNPDGDIAIEEIGLRPGEKLVEELLINGVSEGTTHPRIIKARETMIPWLELEHRLRELRALLERGDYERTLSAIKKLVPGYHREEGEAPVPVEIGRMQLQVVS
jgi:FlaA1/EpsC-like NDP-sugar epimerase